MKDGWKAKRIIQKGWMAQDNAGKLESSKECMRVQKNAGWLQDFGECWKVGKLEETQECWMTQKVKRMLDSKVHKNAGRLESSEACRKV